MATAEDKHIAQFVAGGLPVETVQVLRDALTQQRVVPPHIVAAMDARRLVHRIIKDEAAEKRLHVLATARRFKYCFSVNIDEDDEDNVVDAPPTAAKKGDAVA